MSNSMMLYLFTRLDGLIAFCGVLVGIGGLSIVALGTILAIIRSDQFRDKEDIGKILLIKKWIVISVVLTIFFSVFLVFMPSSKEMAFIYLGGKLADYRENNKDLQEIPDNAIKLLNGKLKEYIEDQEKAK